MKTLAAVALALLALTSYAQPAVSTITPAAGPVAGGEYVHIHGVDLQLVPLPCFPPCALIVRFGGAEAPVVSDSADEIVVLTPPHAPGSVDVEVGLLTKGTVTIANGYRYEDPLPSDSIRFLAPIAVSAPGALGSNWLSELSITNASGEPLTIGSTTIAPQNSAPVTLPNPNVGALFAVPRRIAPNVTATLRVHDTAHDAAGWGTDIPVVPETQFRPTVVLPHVPTDARFRTLLRVYAYTTSFAAGVAVIRDDATGAVLSTQPLLIRDGSSSAPGYAQLSLDLIAAQFASAHERLRIDVTAQILGSILPPVPLWAFVAITNNATGQVTTITPSLIPSTAPEAAPPQLGHWAGGGSCVDVTNTDTNVTMACATAKFLSPKVASNGHFETDGSYTFAGGPAPGHPVTAHFSGTIQGTSMTLTIAPDGGTPFTIQVTYGSQEPCPVICR